MSTESDNIAVVIGAIIIVVLFIFLFMQSRDKGGVTPPAPPAPLPPTKEFEFVLPVRSFENLTLQANGTKLSLEVPVALFVFDKSCNCDSTKQLFQTFATKNSSYLTSFHMNKSLPASNILATALKLQSVALPAVLYFQVGIEVSRLTSTQITDAGLQTFIRKATFTPPLQPLTSEDFTTGGDLIDSGSIALVFVNKAGCALCDAYAPIIQDFAVSGPIDATKFYADADVSPGREFIAEVNSTNTTYPLLFVYAEDKLQAQVSLPAQLTVTELIKIVRSATTTGDFVFKPPADGVVVDTRWNATTKTFASKQSSLPTLILVYDKQTPNSTKSAFQSFATQFPTIANYETLNKDVVNQAAFFTASGYADPTPYPVVIKYDAGGLPNKQITRDFSSSSLTALTTFDFSNIKSVVNENFLTPGTNTAQASYVSASPACVFVYSDSCGCDAKKRVYQQVFNTVSGNLYYANSSDPATSTFFTQTKIDPNIVAIHKWLKTTGVYSPDPITATLSFDLATVTAYVK
jgi:hypothetical protein